MSSWQMTHNPIYIAKHANVGVCCCPNLLRDTWRRCLKAYGEVYVYLMGVDVPKCVQGILMLIWCSKCSILESPERQNFTHVKHQKTQTSLYKLSKNLWVITLLEILGPSEEIYDPQSLWITLYYFLTQVFWQSQQSISSYLHLGRYFVVEIDLSTSYKLCRELGGLEICAKG